MRRLPRRTAALLGAAAIALSFAGPASAESNTYCFTVESVDTTYPRPTTTRPFALCVPWPL